MRPLDDVTIIDFTQRHAGSVATMMLADFGAKVIKVERPDAADPAREWTPKKNGHSVYFTYLNRGKESVCVNYATEEGRKIVLELIKKADVVCESLGCGEMEKYGLDYYRSTIEIVMREVPMFPLSVHGLETGLKKLMS